MKKIAQVVGWICGFLAAFWLLNAGLDLIREPGNAQVYAGIFAVVVSALAFAGLGWIAKEWIALLRAAPIILLAAIGVGCSTTVPPGYAGIVVNMYGGDRGVESFPIKTGRVWYNPWSEDVLSYPCFQQSDTWQDGEEQSGSIVINDRDGMRIGFNVSYSYQLQCDKVPVFYVKFRNDDINQFSDVYLRNTAQEFFNAEGARRSAEELYSTEKEEFMSTVRQRLNERVLTLGVSLDQFSIVGEMSLPIQVKNAIDGKLKATQDAQRVENELRESRATAAKKVAEAEGNANSAITNAKGQAEANRLLAESITPQLLEWRRLSIQQQQAERWNGTLPTTVLGGNSAVPLIQVPR